MKRVYVFAIIGGWLLACADLEGYVPSKCTFLLRGARRNGRRRCRRAAKGIYKPLWASPPIICIFDAILMCRAAAAAAEACESQHSATAITLSSLQTQHGFLHQAPSNNICSLVLFTVYIAPHFPLYLCCSNASEIFFNIFLFYS